MTLAAATRPQATCLRSGQDVVVKAYALSGLSDFLRHQVLRELRIHSRLCNPGVVQMLAAFRVSVRRRLYALGHRAAGTNGQGFCRFSQTWRKGRLAFAFACAVGLQAAMVCRSLPVIATVLRPFSSHPCTAVPS